MAINPSFTRCSILRLSPILVIEISICECIKLALFYPKVELAIVIETMVQSSSSNPATFSLSKNPKKRLTNLPFMWFNKMCGEA